MNSTSKQTRKTGERHSMLVESYVEGQRSTKSVFCNLGVMYWWEMKMEDGMKSYIINEKPMKVPK